MYLTFQLQIRVLSTFPRFTVTPPIVIQAVSCMCLLECQPSARWSMRSTCLPSLWLRWWQCGGGKAIPSYYGYASKPRSLLGVLGLKIDPYESAVDTGPKLSTEWFSNKIFLWVFCSVCSSLCSTLFSGDLRTCLPSLILFFSKLLLFVWGGKRRRKMCLSLSRDNYSYI